MEGSRWRETQTLWQVDVKRVHGPQLVVGDTVWHIDAPLSGDTSKLNRPWQGPYEVGKILNEATIKIKPLGAGER